MDCSLPGSSVHGILQARILEWIVISFSKGSSQPRDWTWVFHIAVYHLSHQGSPFLCSKHSWNVMSFCASFLKEEGKENEIQIGKWNTKLHGKAQRGLEKQYKQWRASLMAQKVKNSPQCRRSGFDPWSRMIPEEGNGNPLQYSCLESCYRARHNWETNKWREGKQKIATHGHYRIITCMMATITGAIHCYLI